MPFFAITGASGGGKSTLIEALAARGFRTQSEVGRALVLEQRAVGGRALPEEDALAFRDLLFQRSLEAFQAHSAHRKEPVFFDRSFVEAIAYSKVLGVPVPPRMMRAAGSRRFDDPVFLCPPWKEIFVTDAERQHDFDFAVRDYAANREAYAAFGYRLVEVPRAPVCERVEFILQVLSQSRYATTSSGRP